MSRQMLCRTTLYHYVLYEYLNFIIIYITTDKRNIWVLHQYPKTVHLKHDQINLYGEYFSTFRVSSGWHTTNVECINKDVLKAWNFFSH